MATRLSERRLPSGWAPADLGDASADADAALIGFHSSPIVTGRRQTYVVFALGASLQASVESHRWQVAGETAVTAHGVHEVFPAATGDLQVGVELLGSGGAVLKRLTLTQEVTVPHPELEALIGRADEVTAVAADPATSRELVNDVRAYIDDLAPRGADSGSSLNRLLFAIAYAEALHVPPPERSAQNERLAASMEAGGGARFAEAAAAGVGLCQVRPQALAMYVGATATATDRLIPRREIPREPAAGRAARQELREALGALDVSVQADLFNLLRFPKSNLRMAMRFVEALRAQYFPDRDLLGILGEEASAKALITQFKEGPLAAA